MSKGPAFHFCSALYADSILNKSSQEQMPKRDIRALEQLFLVLKESSVGSFTRPLPPPPAGGRIALGFQVCCQRRELGSNLADASLKETTGTAAFGVEASINRSTALIAEPHLVGLLHCGSTDGHNINGCGNFRWSSSHSNNPSGTLEQPQRELTRATTSPRPHFIDTITAAGPATRSARKRRPPGQCQARCEYEKHRCRWHRK